MEWLEQLLGEEWNIIPAGGATGEAYFAEQGERRLFLKRNSSPFLAVLSAEGIVPKLLWTKRIASGDVISAQAWLNGNKLEPEDMRSERVAFLLKKIHTSDALLQMIQKLGKQPIGAADILGQMLETLDEEVIHIPIIQKALHYLEEALHEVRYDQPVVCHCDVNHNNWLMSDSDQLYLIDWDGAVVADPALDIGMLLHWYIPREEWEAWLLNYGMALDDSLLRRMKWYVVAQSIISVQWYKSKGKSFETEYWLRYLENLL
ncbi:phosphotransferase family protein [Ectobacillus sp. JY-23]|uniref:phosphotransferase family protein n=1 Tax=Ectobacillus sp. JY-23 TaxID=2933872 RepID=UPI001FF2E836|nr:phosphotransferase family protein [Ectobacillus sp. JY-23]UOY94340.1 phosphotransferase family protein [Ectobacillus sp. JY-23]